MGGVARFNFLDICGLPLGAADYMALARHFHTVFITSIPAMSMQVRGVRSHCVSAWADASPAALLAPAIHTRMYTLVVMRGRTSAG